VLLRVVDQGPGIDPNLLPRIFEPFVSGRDGGTGLGLSIARGVVERHGGTLTADSAPGCGATFSIDLPRGPLGGAR
jgi:two-component system NtrC family sensor kinase